MGKKQNNRYKKETYTYTNYVNERKFTKITDEALQENPLVMCINNEILNLFHLKMNIR